MNLEETHRKHIDEACNCITALNCRIRSTPLHVNTIDGYLEIIKSLQNYFAQLRQSLMTVKNLIDEPVDPTKVLRIGRE